MMLVCTKLNHCRLSHNTSCTLLRYAALWSVTEISTVVVEDEVKRESY